MFMNTNVKKIFVSTTSPTSARKGAGFNPCQGLYHEPADKKTKTAFIATHYNVDFSEHSIYTELGQTCG
jgi:hypothetical protein